MLQFIFYYVCKVSWIIRNRIRKLKLSQIKFIKILKVFEKWQLNEQSNNQNLLVKIEKLWMNQMNVINISVWFSYFFGYQIWIMKFLSFLLFNFYSELRFQKLDF